MRAAALLVTLALGCSRGDSDGPAAITWDRDVCKSCSMVISDRHFAAQVRGGPKNAVAKFSDSKRRAAFRQLSQQHSTRMIGAPTS